MEKWEDVVELPASAEQALSSLRRCIGQIVQRTKRKPIAREVLYLAVLSFATFQQTQDPVAVYGSTAWNHYLPAWLAFERSDLDLKLTQCPKPLHLKNYVGQLIESLQIQFPHHEFEFRESRHNGNRTLVVFCDQDHFLDVSIVNHAEVITTVQVGEQNIPMMSLEWLLRDLQFMLGLPTASYRRERDLNRLARIVNAHRLGLLPGIESSAQDLLSILSGEHKEMMNLIPTSYFNNDADKSPRHELAQVKASYKRLKRDLKQEQSESLSLQSQVKQLTDAHSRLTSELQASYREQERMSSELEQSQQKLKSTIAEADNKLKASQIEAESLRQKTNNLNQELRKHASKPKPAAKKGKKTPDRDHLLLQQIKSEQADTIDTLRKKVSELQSESTSLQSLIQTQGGKVSMLLESRSALQRENNDLLARVGNMASRHEHAIYNSQLALASFIRSQRFFQQAMSTIFYQNAMQLLSIASAKDIDMLCSQTGNTISKTITCRTCVEGYLSTSQSPDPNRFLICCYSYNARVFTPQFIGMYDNESSSPSSESSSNREGITIEIPPSESPTAPTEGVMCIPLLSVRKEPGASLAKPKSFIKGRQKFDEDDEFYYTLCPGCLVDNVQEVVSRQYADSIL
jgi:flagellar biosynthesis GTPase FlhF